MAYDDFKKRIRDDWRDTLRSILERARSQGSSAVLAFDLDSTLFDNRPRQARILREYGAARSLAVLAACEPHHWVTGWDMKEAMRACGLEDALVESHFAEARRFWAERFFTSDYCVDDEAIDGAASFTHEVVATGARLVYVTGRHEAMREGSVSCMRRHGLVLPDDDRVLLVMKPTLAEDDDAFKREAHARLGRLGSVVAAFDNEPTHANDYRRKFPEATVIHLATDHSGRPVELLDGVISVPHFALGS
ncbi:hypothetical protein MXAN_2665 [Myxococcus xanthus DK 1622]|uniref:Haloacid dehalogenase-like hydrolase n=1 Tax=Myxococcus xanthus (strain DK1622) TaxID=246197 RepID=Q1D8Y9_MYXXD|nr:MULTISPECIES: hypothetical protein [Myxococcus]ABF90148.1 hypothetical protein MXAN_2665 [Myxococcus xanthus DK 1622]NOJ53742.1 hypothetical protein [Myxococcus xanthus]QDE89603.1 hypothetical protein BHS06_11860 [Myxococcus xanthus]QPM82170.1 hypothetical protein I5Q59_13210 [Myxococcus xanthus]QQR46937.1 hypothetical protein JKA73_13055 [Myxococcus xanthus]